MKITINHKYIALQGLFWMIYCVGVGFISMCLQNNGLNNGEIGVVTASFGLVSAVLQPALGRICDKHPEVTWKKMLLILSVPIFFICILETFFQGKFWGIFCVGTLIFLVNTIMPFLNAALSDYQGQDIYVNFGIARGTGSFTFAVLAVIIGQISLNFGTKAVSVSGIVVSVLFILVVLSLPCKPLNLVSKETAENSEKVTTESGEKAAIESSENVTIKSGENTASKSKVKIAKKAGEKSFIRKYPSFIVMFVAFIFSSTSHNLLGTYLLQFMQSIGGTNDQFGIAIAVQAVVEVPVLFLFAKIVKKISARNLMLIATIGYGCKAVWYALTGSIVMVYFVQITQMISFAIFASASVYYTLKAIKKEDQVTGQAMMTSIMVIGSVLGSLIGGMLIDNFGMRAMLNVNMVIAAIGIVLAFISVFVFTKFDTYGGENE
ncbi:MAG: MFS transporter [Lachnospiraceae bacterium]|nr:MFS transporter [Lachnospiraceae bacterium]